MVTDIYKADRNEPPPLLSVLACEGLAAEDAVVEEVMGSFASVAVCEERQPEVEVVVAPVA